MAITVVVERLIDVRCPICGKLYCRAAEGSVVEIKCRHDGVQTSQIQDGRNRPVSIEATARSRNFCEEPPVCVEGDFIDA